MAMVLNLHRSHRQRRELRLTQRSGSVDSPSDCQEKLISYSIAETQSGLYFLGVS